MGFVILFVFIVALVFVLIAVHEMGHYLAGLFCGIPARDMRLMLLTFPQHVAVRDDPEWVSPVRDIHRYIQVTQRHLQSRSAAFLRVSGGIVLETAFTAALWCVAMATGYPTVGFWVA